MNNMVGVPTWFVALVAAPALLIGCDDEACHIGEHVGGYSGDLDGVIRLELSRVDADDLVEITLEGDDEGFPLTGLTVASAGAEGACSDMFFEGALEDSTGTRIGDLEGALTTTTAEGTWTLTTGESGTWALGKQ